MKGKAGENRAKLLAFLAGKTDRCSIKDMFLESDLTEYAIRYLLPRLEDEELVDRVPLKGTTNGWDMWALTDKGREAA